MFLARRLENFSDFLYDDSVTTRLAREVTAFTAPSDVQRPRKNYPVEWGQTLANEFREYYGLEEESSQNVSAGGISFLDDYRSLLTEIGNGLGLVFLLTQGRQQFLANNRQFLAEVDPETVTSPGLDPALRSAGIGRATTDAPGRGLFQPELRSLTRAANLAGALDSLILLTSSTSNEHDALSSAFSKLLLGFRPQLLSVTHRHLAHFYMLVPALSLSYVETMLLAKERLTQRGPEALYSGFTDDGFPLGLAFMLLLLRQQGLWEELHWASSVTDYYAAEKRKALGS